MYLRGGFPPITNRTRGRSVLVGDLKPCFRYSRLGSCNACTTVLRKKAGLRAAENAHQRFAGLHAGEKPPWLGRTSSGRILTALEFGEGGRGEGREQPPKRGCRGSRWKPSRWT
jgi:hypothetical protein